MSENSVIIIGNGGHAKVLCDCLTCMNIEVLGFIDESGSADVLGDDAWLEENADEYKSSHPLVNGIGSTTLPTQRQEIFEKYKALGFKFLTVIHPSAIIAQDIAIEEGAQIMAGAILQSNTTVGANAIINTRASIDHDCTIGAHTHIAPGCTLSGNVTIGETSHIGTCSTIIQSITIGSNALAAAGSVIVNNVPDNAKIKGHPAQ